jgi:hypothetical protein
VQRDESGAAAQGDDGGYGGDRNEFWLGRRHKG